MMNNNVVIPSSSECSSGCESGWTLYLQHSTNTFSNNGFRKRSFDDNEKQELQKMAKFEDLVDNKGKDGYYWYREEEDEDEDEDEEEDLSMVSDASSGPPHFDHDIDDVEEDSNNGGRLRKQCMKSYGNESHYCANNMADDDFALDDTASSHVFTSKKMGGIHVQNHQNASFERLIGYSSQGYSATHFQVGLNSRKIRADDNHI